MSSTANDGHTVHISGPIWDTTQVMLSDNRYSAKSQSITPLTLPGTYTCVHVHKYKHKHKYNLYVCACA